MPFYSFQKNHHYGHITPITHRHGMYAAERGCYSTNFNWVGSGSDAWSNAANWSDEPGGTGGVGVPDDETEVVLDANSGDCHINAAAEAFSVTLARNYAGTMYIDAPLTTISNFTLADGYVVADADLQIGGAMSQGDGSFTNTDNLVDIQWLDLNGGSFTSTSETLTVHGDFSDPEGYFVHNGGTVLLADDGYLDAGAWFGTLQTADNTTITVNVLIFAGQLIIGEHSHLALTHHTFIVLGSSPSALQSGTGSKIIVSSPEFFDNVAWATMADTGTYHIPFATPEGDDISVTFHIGPHPGDDAGFIVVSTYGTNPDYYPVNNLPHMPTMDAYYDTLTNDQSLFAVDRHWKFESSYNGAVVDALTLKYTANDIGGQNIIDPTRLEAEVWDADGFAPTDFTRIPGTVNTTEKTFTFVPLAGTNGIMLYDSETVPFDDGTTCEEAIELDTLGETLFSMTDTLWLKFAATDTLMHIYVGEELNPMDITSLSLYGGPCNDLSLMANIEPTGYSEYLLLTYARLQIDSVYFIRVTRPATDAVFLKGPKLSRPILPPVAPEPQMACSDTAVTFIFEDVEAGYRGNQIEWSLFQSFEEPTIVLSPADIIVTTQDGAFDTVWIRSRSSETNAVSHAVFTNTIVYRLPNPPIPPIAQRVQSDIAYTFEFQALLDGQENTVIEWAFDSNFTSSVIDTSPAFIEFVVEPDTFQQVWLRTVDTITGCMSAATNTVGIVETILEPREADTVIYICAGSSTTVCVPASQSTLRYDLMQDETLIDSEYGNDDELCLNTGTIHSLMVFDVWAFDPLTETSTLIDSQIVIAVLEPVDSIEFVDGDTLNYAGDTSNYLARAINCTAIIYSIESGSASVDSLTGVVTGVTTDFTIRATAYGVTDCGTIYTEMPVKISEIEAPEAIEPIRLYADSLEDKLVTLSNIYAGSGGNQIEWATNEHFIGSTIVSSPATINITVPTGHDTIVWLRSRHNETGRVSKKTSRQISIHIFQLSAGLLNKSNWDLAWYDEFESYEGLPAEEKNKDFLDHWSVNYCMESGGSCSSYAPANHTTAGVDSNSMTLVNTGNLDGTGIDGSAGEVTFSGGKAILSIDKLETPITFTSEGVTNNYHYKTPVMTRHVHDSLNRLGMLEIRCKAPLEDAGQWTAAWYYRNEAELDVFDNPGGTADVNKSRMIDRLREKPDTTHVGCGSEMTLINGCDLSEDWHTHTCMWSDDEVIMFLDGKEYWSYSIHATPDDFPKFIDDDFVTRLMIGATATSYIEEDDEHFEEWIDYVRFYKLKSGISCAKPLHYLSGCNAETLESPGPAGPMAPGNNHPLIMAKGGLGLGTHIAVGDIGFTSAGVNATMFYLSSIGYAYKLEMQAGGMAKEQPVISFPYSQPWTVNNNLTPASNSLLYYKTPWVAPFTMLGASKQSGPLWKSRAFSKTIGLAGNIKLDGLGRIFYKGIDNNIYSYDPSTDHKTKITTDGSVGSLLQVHSCGCIVLYRDHSNKMRQLYWLNTWQALPYPVVNQAIVTDWTVMDESNSRIYFIGTDKAVYSYLFHFSIPNSGGLMKLGDRSYEGDNSSSLCSDYYNALSSLTQSHDKKLLFYRATDGEIWYYFNDRENNKVSEPNWNKTRLLPFRKVTGFLSAEPGGGERLFYVNKNFRISVVDWVNADNPVICDTIEDTIIYGYVGKTAGKDSISNIMQRPVFDRDTSISIRVYPNPSDNIFTIKVNTQIGEGFDLYIYDMMGTEVLGESYPGADNGERTIRWDASGATQGIYFYTVRSASGKTLTGRIIKL